MAFAAGFEQGLSVPRVLICKMDLVILHQEKIISLVINH